MLSTADAQRIDSFGTADVKVYLADFDGFVNGGKRDVAAKLFKSFSRKFSAYTPEQQATIMRVTNQMLEKGMSSSPYFEDYMTALEVVPYATEYAKSFDDWHAALLALMDGMSSRKFKGYANFLDFSASFFADGSLRSSSSLTWFARSKSFSMRVEGSTPIIHFDTVNLVGIRRTDSIAIMATSGDYYPADTEFKGTKGRVYWDRHGLTDAYAFLGDYTVDVTKSLYKADSVKMTYPLYFGDERVLGKFEDKISTTSGNNTASYPRFTSYESVLKLTDIGEGLTYTGGFRLHGLTVYGDGGGGSSATVELRNEGGKLIYRGVADAFVIRRGERIVGSQVNSTFYHGLDSIIHPSVNFRYNIPERILSLIRGDRAADRNPFYASQQDVNFDVDEVKIMVAQDSILFGEQKRGIGKGNKAVTVQSLQYFSASDYNRYQSIATYNPLDVIKAVAEREGRRLDGLTLAKKIDSRFTLESVKTLYFDLVADGFISYDIKTSEVVVKEKIFHYIDAKNNKVDFDGYNIVSKTEETNASFDLLSGDMLLNGVKNLELSRKQRVALVPFGGQMVMQNDRDVEFDGTLYAGYSVLNGSDMHYQYKDHQIGLDSVRYLDFFIPADVEPGVKAPPPAGLSSRIEHVQGTLLVDAPGNKSGKEEIPIFPSLQTSAPSYVYYDLPQTHDTAYTRDSFYFALDPFSFNSLDNYTKEQLRFKGMMYSAMIFPPYKEDIYVREEDSSLGHLTETAAGGWPTYQRKGNFEGALDLSNKGYYGEGTLKYLTATVDALDFLFKPKRMSATAKAFNMVEDRTGSPKTPKASGEDVSLDWAPYLDSMYVQSEEAAFNIFASGEHKLEGRLILTPSGLKGQGVHDWPLATLRSRLLAYGPFSADSDTLYLAIKTEDGENIALEADNLNGQTDFDKNIGVYKANDEFIVIDLPANMYQTSMNEFTWDINSREIAFKSKPGQLGKFVSTAPDQDSLYFEGETAKYNLAGSSLDLGGVPFIATADALVYTADGEVQVSLGGEMGELKNARIVADTINKFHVIDSATVNIKGRKGYTARGYYRYDLPSRTQRVLFAEVVGERIGKGKSSEKAAVTRASGEVKSADKFYIDEKTSFKGIITLDASRPELTFDGFAKLDAPGVDKPRWFSINTLGNKDNLLIPYDLPKAPEGDDLYTGIFLSRESQEAYPLVFQPTHTGQDRAILDLSEGLLDHRPKSEEFLVGDSLRVLGKTRQGAMMSINVNTGAIKANGPLALGDELDYISVKAAGDLKTGYEKPANGGRFPALETDALLSIDLIIPEKLLNLVAADITAAGFDAPDVNYATQSTFLQQALPNWVANPKDSSSIAAAKGGAFVLQKNEPKHSFIFPKLPLVYNGEYQSFFSANNKIDIAFINGSAIHKRIEGYVEIKMPGSGDDRLYVYLKSPSDTWYFFGFKQGILNVSSSSPRFMESLESLKSKELAIKMDDGEIYEILPVNAGSAASFVARVKEAR
ncbi:MAG: hypothetical protein AB8F78_16480 [Saprospiraceae bacterium]